MKRLNYQTLAENGYQGYLLQNAPERVLQFGEGNFLRAFVEDFIDQMNEKAGFDAKVVLVQPRGGHPESADLYTEQEGLYTLVLRGRENGQSVERTRVISCASRCLDPKRDWDILLDCAKNPDLRFIISNTTEAGIVFDPACKQDDAPPAAFPAKLTQFLHRRWTLGGKGFIILSCELIDHNGDELKRCVNEYIKLWGLEADFAAWVEKENIFCSTLVDRIVTGGAKAEAPALCEKWGYEDKLIDTGEVFAAWVIEGPQAIRNEFPFEKAGLPIQVVDNVTPYKQRKVRILNGAHTSMVLGAYLAGKQIVRECMEDGIIRGFLNKTLFDEIIPTLDLPKEELTEFAASVIDRFNNPYIDHRLTDIALNSTAKWKARVMPSLTEYVKRFGKLPECLTFSFAAYAAFYKKGGEAVRDDQWVLDFYREHANDDARAFAHAVVHNEQMWGGELKALPGFEEAVAADLARIDESGMYEAMGETALRDQNCGYCMRGELLDKFGLYVCDLSVSTLILFKEQSHPGRCIVAYKDHVGEIVDISDEERNAFFADVNRAAKAIHAVFHPDKLNYGAYGDTGRHLHMHLVPKYKDQYEWGGVFEMNPGKVLLRQEEYDDMIAKLKAAL